MRIHRKAFINGISTLLVFPLMLCSSNLWSQNKPNAIIPPSPTAAALGKYGDIPVSNYTGVPNISIPIYNIQSGTINLPISLSYHASGIKVEEEASWVGLGWSVQAGGVITRSVRGNDDLSTDPNRMGYPNSPFPISVDATNNYVPSGNNFADTYFFQAINNGQYDAEPDIFYFNFAGHSGKFYIKKRTTPGANYEFLIESQEKLKIEHYGSSPSTWAITTGDGTKYVFGTEEKTLTSNGFVDGYEPSPNYHILDPNPLTVTSSWYLDEIIAPDGNSVSFLYSSPSPSKRTLATSEERVYLLKTDIISQSAGCNPEGLPPYHRYFSSMNIVYDVYLNQINFKNGNIKFETSNRLDIEPFQGGFPKKLDQIIISEVSSLDNSVNEVKNFQFNYSYFSNSDPRLNYSIHTRSYNVVNTYSGKRLKLNSLTETNGSATNPPFEFNYESSSYYYGDIPDKYSKSKDHWGFFNDGNNTTVQDPQSTYGIVSTNLPPYSDFVRSKYYSGADREPNENHIKLGMLNRIKYPSGGTTSFEYQSNDYSNFPNQSQVEKLNLAIATAGDLVINALDYFEPTVNAVEIITFSAPTAVKVVVNWQYTMNFCASPTSYGGSGALTIQNDVGTPVFQKVFNNDNIQCDQVSTTSQTIIVPSGTYKISAFAQNHAITTAYISYEHPSNTPLLQKKGGGVRVSKITDYNGFDHSSDIITQFKYTSLDYLNRERSSGVLMSFPNYEYAYTISSSRSCGYSAGVFFNSTYLKRTSQSNIPLGNSAQGSLLGYSTVTVSKIGYGENGFTVYNYENEPDQFGGTFFPNLPNQPHLSNGLLKSQIVFKKNNSLIGNPFQKVTETTKEYISEPTSRQVIKGFKWVGGEFIENAILNGIAYIPLVKFYNSASQWSHQSKETTISYDSDEQNPVSSITNYYYDNPLHLQLTRTEKAKSDGKVITMISTFPEDYPLGTAFIDEMKTNFITTLPIEQVSYQSDQTGTKILDGQIIQYQYGGLINKISKLELNGPLNIVNFKFSNKGTGILPFPLAGPLGNYSIDDAYKEKVTFNQYGDYGNILMVTHKNRLSTSYQYGYNQAYPIAECRNASVNNIFHENFEESGSSSGIGNSKTGSYSHIGTYAKSLTSLDNGIYKLSYWHKLGTEWTQQTDIVSVNGNGYTISFPSGQYDDINFCPKDALMTTYTYKPLVGMTSKTDAKGMTTYYEYDEFQRLKNVKDQNGNIISSNQYHYKPQ